MITKMKAVIFDKHINAIKMRKILLVIILMCLPMLVKAQTVSNQQRLDSIHASLKVLANLSIGKEFDRYSTNTYKLYPTNNINIFLLLNTSNGKIKLVQWSLNQDKEFSKSLNDIDLSYGIKIGNPTERFELYPTQNIYQFLLLDKAVGIMWHVQWGTEAKNCWIVPIKG